MKGLLPEARAKESAALERERVSLKVARVTEEKKRAIREKVEYLSVRINDTLSALEVAKHEKDDLQEHLRAALVLSAEIRAEKDQMVEGPVASVREVEVLRKKVVDLESDVHVMKQENREVEAFPRLTARVVLMQRHLKWKDHMASAADEVRMYLTDVGTEKDLDSEDDKNISNGSGDEEADDEAMDPHPP